MSVFYKPNDEVLSKQYWARPANKNQGDADVDTVYRAVGYALSRWENVEETLEQVFVNVCETERSSSNPIKRAFGAVESGSVRRNMILAAAAAFLGHLWEDKDIRLSFFRVIEAVSFASKRRDDIAHGTVQNFRDKEPFGGHGAFLLPAMYNTGRTKTYVHNDGIDPLYFTFTDFRFTSEDINDIAGRFQKLDNAVAYLSGFMRKLDDGTILFARAVKGEPVIKI